MRRFELQEGTSNKFWEVWVEGSAITVRFGRTGTQGQSKTRDLGSPTDAAQEQASLIAEKLKKGYQEVPVVAGEEPLDEAAHRTWLVSPAGDELPLTLSGNRVIEGAGQHRRIQALGSAAAAKDHLERVIFLRQKVGWKVARTEEIGRDRDAESPQAEALAQLDGEVKLEDGRMTVTFNGDGKVPQKICEAIVARARGAGARTLQLICDFAVPGVGWARAIDGKRMEDLRAFIFDVYFQTPIRQADNSVGDLARTLRAAPGLERLFATGALQLSAVTHEALRELCLIGVPLTEAVLDGLVASELPALERLVLALSSETKPGPDQAVAAKLRNLNAPKLREVHLTDVADVPAFLQTFLAAGLPRSWRTVSVAGTWAGAASAEELAPLLEQHAAEVRKLDVLAVPLGEEPAEGLPLNVRDAEEFRDRALPATYQGW